MKVKFRNKVLLFLMLVTCIGFAPALWQEEKAVTATLVTKQKFYKAGEVIACEFLFTLPVATQLHIQSAYGSTVLFSTEISKKAIFEIPRFIAKKRGVINYTLFHKGKPLDQGIFTVYPNPKTTLQLETYIGPPSIIAGGIDYAMQVDIPTDGFDNPLAEDTKVDMKHQFLEIERSDPIPIEDMIAWKRIYSYTSSGRMLLSTTVHKTSAKEAALEVFAAQPTAFQIQAHRKHQYADGNQITEFTTNILRDRYGNVVTDGTYVSFRILTEKGMQLQTGGTTINGIATAKMLHPDHETQWQVKAFVSGMAESNTIVVSYTPVLDHYEVAFSEDCREITVGPLRSFMNQLIPDGAMVKLQIVSSTGHLETKIKTANEGRVTFVLSEDFYPSQSYTFTLTALGVTQQFKNVLL